MISLLGIVIGLALFILLAYMGYNTIIVAIASAMVVTPLLLLFFSYCYLSFDVINDFISFCCLQNHINLKNSF